MDSANMNNSDSELLRNTKRLIAELEELNQKDEGLRQHVLQANRTQLEELKRLLDELSADS